MLRTYLLFTLSAFILFGPVTDAMAIDLGLGILKRRRKAETPTQVEQLLSTLLSDPDEKKRLAAVEDLADADPRTNGSIIPTLIAALQRDPSSAVRLRAVQVLGSLKTVSQPAGLAMEAALQTDPDTKVRDALKASLWEYHLNGYRAAGMKPKPTQSSEPPLASRTRPTAPPLAEPKVTQPVRAGFRPITNTVGKGSFYQPTAEPPLAKPAPTTAAPATPTSAPSADTPTIPAPMPTIPAPMPTKSVPSTSPTPTVRVPTNPLPPITIPVPMK